MSREYALYWTDRYPFTMAALGHASGLPHPADILAYTAEHHPGLTDAQLIELAFIRH